MHELSIAHELVRIVERAAREAGATRVTGVHLRLGVLSGVVREALEFAFGFAVEETLLQDARLFVEEVQLTAFCEPCGREVVLEDPSRLRCPACATSTPELRSGRELEVRAIDYVDGPRLGSPGGSRHAEPSPGFASDPASGETVRSPRGPLQRGPQQP